MISKKEIFAIMLVPISVLTVLNTLFRAIDWGSYKVSPEGKAPCTYPALISYIPTNILACELTRPRFEKE